MMIGLSHLKEFDCKKIGYYGKPIGSLTKEELLEAFEELAAIIYEVSVKDKKLEKSIFFKKEESKAGENIHFKNTKKTKY